MPSLRKRFRETKEERSPIDGFDGLMILDGAASTGSTGLAIGVVAALLVIVFLPLLGVALELVLLLALLGSGIFGRLVLGRPWTVETINLDDGKHSVAYAVKGFRRAGQAAQELATALAAGGPPERLVTGERTTLPRPTS